MRQITAPCLHPLLISSALSAPDSWSLLGHLPLFAFPSDGDVRQSMLSPYAPEQSRLNMGIIEIDGESGALAGH